MNQVGADEFEQVTGAWLGAGLDDALTRLDHVLLRAGAGALSFDIGTPEPERELLATLASLGQEPVSFATEIGDPKPTDQHRVMSGLQRLLELATTAARVETRAQDRLVASTWVGHGGDVISSASSSASPDDLASHSSALAQSLQARRIRMRLVVSTVQAAIKIALAIGSPNPLAALPAAWQFIRSVIAEWKPRS